MPRFFCEFWGCKHRSSYLCGKHSTNWDHLPSPCNSLCTNPLFNSIKNSFCCFQLKILTTELSSHIPIVQTVPTKQLKTISTFIYLLFIYFCQCLWVRDSGAIELGNSYPGPDRKLNQAVGQSTTSTDVAKSWLRKMAKGSGVGREIIRTRRPGSLLQHSVF